MRGLRDLLTSEIKSFEFDAEPHLSVLGCQMVTDWVRARYQRTGYAIDNPTITDARTGKLAKRIAKDLFKRWGIKLDDEDKNALGQIINSQTISVMAYRYDVVDSFCWDKGDFGDPTSCYWGGKAAAKPALQHSGNFAAIRFYDDVGTRGLGRALLYTKHGGIVCFNQYGNSPTGVAYDLVNTATLIQSLTGAALIQPITCDNYGKHDGMVWVNGGRAVYVADAPVEMGHIDLRCDYKRYERMVGACHTCSTLIFGGDEYLYLNHLFCSECALDHTYTCGCCGELRETVADPATSVHAPGGIISSMCPRCVRRENVMACVECGTHWQVRDLRMDATGAYVCPRCVSVHAAPLLDVTLSPIALDFYRDHAPELREHARLVEGEQVITLEDETGIVLTLRVPTFVLEFADA
jgi:hypothetical protein